MKTTKIRLKKCVALIATLVACIVCTTVLLTSCNPLGDGTQTASASLYLSGFDVDEDGITETALIRLTGNEEDKIDVTVTRTSVKHPESIWFDLTDYTYVFSGDDVWSDVYQKAVAYNAENDLHPENLNITFEYATIYKSVASDGDVAKSGKYYLHDFDVPRGTVAISLQFRNQNSATWYSVLLAVALGLAILSFGVVLGVKKVDVNNVKEL